MSDFRIDCPNTLYRLGTPAWLITDFADIPCLAGRVARDYRMPFACLLVEQPLAALAELAAECKAWAD